eukprot:10049492-Alexandrium_andersonii.AAC.1
MGRGLRRAWRPRPRRSSGGPGRDRQAASPQGLRWCCRGRWNGRPTLPHSGGPRRLTSTGCTRRGPEPPRWERRRRSMA